MLHPLWATLLLTLLASCPAGSRPGPAVEQPQATGSEPPGMTPSASCMCGGLSFDGQQLSWQAPSGADLAVAMTGEPVPYQIASAMPPVLVTALLPGLQPVTYVAGTATVAEPEFLPTSVQPPLVALETLPDPLSGSHAAALLLQPDGNVLWQTPEGWQSELAVPQVHTADAPTLAYVFCWQEGTALTPYGDRPQLRSIGLGAAPQEQRLTLPLAHNAADLVVLGDTGTRVLLLAQYGYQEFEFLLCEMSDQPRLIARWPVAGQALAWLDYPGPAPVYTGLQQAGAQLSLIVHDEQAAAEYERWSFNLSSGELTRTSYTGVLPRAADSSNAVDDSAAGPPYPQTLLPTAGEAPWNIPAVCDMQGRVLVIYSSGSFEWIKPGAAAATAADRTAAKACAANACITPPPQ